MIEKAVKIRSPKHLAFVKSHPCLVTKDGEHCNGVPVDPHHLMKMGGRGKGLKECDKWAVPACRRHHHEVTIAGDEEKYWLSLGMPYDEIVHMAICLQLNSPCKKVEAAAHNALGDESNMQIEQKKN